MDLAGIVERIPGVVPFPGIPVAWKWSPAPGLDFVAALDSTESVIFRINTRDSFDECLVADTILLARHVAPRISASSPAFTEMTGLACRAYDFDVVALMRPDIYVYGRAEFPVLAAHSQVLFPAFAGEFGGNETADEARMRFTRAIGPSVLTRSPAPFLKIEYRNDRARSGSTGTGRTFMTYDVLPREIALLENVAGAYVEFENYLHHVWRVTWDGDFILDDGAVTRTSLAPLLEFTRAAVFDGAETFA